MIKSLKDYEINEEREKKISENYESLVKDFNEEAKKQKSKFKLKIEGEECCLQKIFFGFNNLGNYNIKYNLDLNTFSFEEGIELDLYQEVYSILKELKQEFEIEVIKDD